MKERVLRGMTPLCEPNISPRARRCQRRLVPSQTTRRYSAINGKIQEFDKNLEATVGLHSFHPHPCKVR